MNNQVTRSFFHVCAFRDGGHSKPKEQNARGMGRVGLNISMFREPHRFRVEKAKAGGPAVAPNGEKGLN